MNKELKEKIDAFMLKIGQSVEVHYTCKVCKNMDRIALDKKKTPKTRICPKCNKLSFNPSWGK